MKRSFLVAGLSIAVLFGASVVAIILVLTSPPPTPATPDPSSPPPPPVAVASSPPSPPVAVAPAPPGPPVAVAPAPPGQPVAARFKGGKLYPMATDRRGETSVPMADRATEKAVRKALRAVSVQSRLARCTRVEGFGGTSGIGGVPRTAPASLLLQLEARGGELRVVDANVREWGEASEAMVSCARTVLRSQVIPAPKTRRSAGERLQMHFRLSPRGDAVASG